MVLWFLVALRPARLHQSYIAVLGSQFFWNASQAGPWKRAGMGVGGLSNTPGG